MKSYKVDNIRNIGLIGHSSVGKTSLVEALLYSNGNIDRLGKVEEGTTVSDFDPEEKRRGISISVSIESTEINDTKINIIDIPGYFDFSGELIQGMRAVDVATIVVSGVSGVQVGTEKAWDYCNKIKLPRAFFINKLDRENSSYERTLEELKSKFGISVVPLQFPIGSEENLRGIVNVISGKTIIYDEKNNYREIDASEDIKDKIDEYKNIIMEAVAETSEEYLEKYFSEGELSNEDIYEGLARGCASGDIAPVMCGSSLKVIGMKSFLEDIVSCFPSPRHAIGQKAKELESEKEIFVSFDETKPFSALVFKTIADPFVGKISLFKVITGELSNEVSVINSNKGKFEKISNIFFMNGKNQIQTKRVIAGDIAAVSKLQYTETGDTLCDVNYKLVYDKMNFPRTNISMAILPVSKNDEDKISTVLQKLQEEDPTFKVERDVENAETIISGIGEIHLEVIASKIKNKYGVDVMLRTPKIPYRETIKGTSYVQGKHKKQSGGHGQYGDVKIQFEPRNDGETDLEFVDSIVGGVVPKNFIPAVEKGLRESIEKGVLAGYPVIGLKATLKDGSYHTVDSSEMAFKMATYIAYKKGLEQAKPVLLEPIMSLEVIIPEENMGDVIGDINKRRGRVIGMEPYEKMQKIIAEVPMAEITKYSTDLSSMTQARGSFKSEFLRYEEVPDNIAKKIIEEAKRN
ncbi:elongation factor G [Caproiciproducens sp. MSJ-32]|uniref:elongation factor G n=1 Tax=Caproiciproducens sp. MSJ-32 TaxID=2841527 RepID=UPI001C122B97|nr:elongation factor G [Caproiciproducens sp. MSJ-32]MBU5453815.1 elongation factor G [Caproiciproducens sp. MSJ-32]